MARIGMPELQRPPQMGPDVVPREPTLGELVDQAAQQAPDGMPPLTPQMPTRAPYDLERDIARHGGNIAPDFLQEQGLWDTPEQKIAQDITRAGGDIVDEYGNRDWRSQRGDLGAEFIPTRVPPVEMPAGDTLNPTRLMGMSKPLISAPVLGPDGMPPLTPQDTDTGYTPMPVPSDEPWWPQITKPLARAGQEALGRALPAAEAIQKNVLEPYVYGPNEAAAGLTSTAIRTALGDTDSARRFEEAYKRTGNIYDAAKEAYSTESIPVVTGLLEPLNLLPFPGPRALFGKGAEVATEATARGVRGAAEAAGMAGGRAMEATMRPGPATVQAGRKGKRPNFGPHEYNMESGSMGRGAADTDRAAEDIIQAGIEKFPLDERQRLASALRNAAAELDNFSERVPGFSNEKSPYWRNLADKLTPEAGAGKAAVRPPVEPMNYYVNLTKPQDIEAQSPRDSFKQLYDKRVEQGRMLGPFSTKEEAQAALDKLSTPPEAAAGVTPSPASPLTTDELRAALENRIPIGPGPAGAATVRADLAGGGTRPPTEPPTGGIPPTTPPTSGIPPASSGGLDKLHAMWDAGAKEPTTAEKLRTVYANLPDTARSFQEGMADRFAGINALSKQSERAVSLLGGVGEAQAQRATDIADAVRTALGDPWPKAQQALDDYLHLKQAVDIAAEKGAGRMFPGGIRGSEAPQLLAELQASLGETKWAQIEKAAATAVAESQATLQRMVDSGLVSQDLATTLLAKYPHYNKQNILREVDQIATGLVSSKRISVTSANLKRLTEEGTATARTSPYASIIGSGADAEALIARNNAARQVAEDAIAQGIGKRIGATKPVAVVEGATLFRRPPGEIPGTMSYMENGQRVVVDVPKWLENEAKAISQAPDPASLTNAIAHINALPRAAFVTYNPAWPAANLMSDYLAAAITKSVSPQEEFRGLAGAVRDLWGNDPVLAQMRRSGAGQSGWFAKSPQDIAKLVKSEGNLALDEGSFLADLKNPGKLLKDIAATPFRAVRTAGQVAENATRRAVFTTELKRAGGQIAEQGANATITATPDMLANAAMSSRRATIDFARGGNFTKAANAYSVFLNAGVQGLLLPGRALIESPRARWGLGLAVGANMGIYAYNRQFPEYADVPDDVKRGSVVLMLPSQRTDSNGKPVPRYLTIIPKVREWGIFFGTTTYILEALDKVQHENLGTFLGTQMAQATPFQGIGTLTNFLTVPGAAAVEQMTNQNFYTNRAIVPPEMAGLPATQQYDSYTSRTVKDLAQSLGISPMRLQEGFTAMTGGAGKTALTISDAILNHLNPKPVDFHIAQLTHEYEQIHDPLQRAEYLNGLSVSDKNAMLEMFRQPQPQIPVLGAMASRFYGERGGEQAALNRENAAQASGISQEQTAKMGIDLSKVSDQIRTTQEQQDAQLALTPNSADAHKAWIAAHSDNGQKYGNVLEGFGVIMPQAAQLQDRETWTKYQNDIYTAAGTQPDSRSKGQILAAGYRAIPMGKIDPLTPDFKTFFQRRDEYKASLSPEDQRLLDRTLQAGYTPTEKQYYAAQETLRPYWDVADYYRKKWPWADDVLKKIEEIEQWPPGPQKDAELTAWRNTQAYKAYNKAVREDHKTMRVTDNAVWAAGEKWHGWTGRYNQ